MNTIETSAKNSLYLELYKVPKNCWDWIDCVLQWAYTNIFISSIPIFITAFLPYFVRQLEPSSDEIIVAVSVTAISVALTNSQFPDEIKERKKRFQKWFQNLTNIILILCLITITVFSLRGILPGVNTNGILLFSIIYAVFGIIIGLLSHITQLYANDEKLDLAKAQIDEGYAEELKEDMQKNSLIAQKITTVNNVKI